MKYSKLQKYDRSYRKVIHVIAKQREKLTNYEKLNSLTLFCTQFIGEVLFNFAQDKEGLYLHSSRSTSYLSYSVLRYACVENTVSYVCIHATAAAVELRRQTSAST